MSKKVRRIFCYKKTFSSQNYEHEIEQEKFKSQWSKFREIILINLDSVQNFSFSFVEKKTKINIKICQTLRKFSNCEYFKIRIGITVRGKKIKMNAAKLNCL